MPDSPIHDLNSASSVTSGDLFVLEQDGQAKKLEGQGLLNYIYEHISAEGLEELFVVPMTINSDNTVDLGGSVTMQDIHDAKEAGKFIIGRAPSLTLLFESEWNYDDTDWMIYFGAFSPQGINSVAFSQNRSDNHDGEMELSPLLPEAPRDSKQYARRNGTWSEVQGGSGTEEVFVVPMSVYSYGAADLRNGVTMQDIHDAKEAGKLIVGEAFNGSTVLFVTEQGYETSGWNIQFIQIYPREVYYITFSQDRLNNHDGEVSLTQLVSEAPSDSKQYARRNGEWSEVQGGSGVDEVFIAPMSMYSDGTVDLRNGVTMGDIHDAREAGKLVVGEDYSGSTALFVSDSGYGTSTWEIQFILFQGRYFSRIFLSQNRTDNHNGEWTWGGLVEDAPSDDKQYARRNGAWSEVQGGSGSSDFEALTNRPKYNGTTMSRSTNIPQVKTSVWDAKYDKPSGGIPKTDLASAVQTSLNKADTALQSHQSLPAQDHVYNVKDYGAVGDGETDDYAAIMAALTAAAEDGGTVYLPGGTYLLSRSLGLNENFGAVAIVGESSRSVTLRYGGSWFAVDLYRSDTAVTYGAVLAGFTVVTDYNYAGGIGLSHQGQCVVEDIVIYYGGSSPSMMSGLEISSCSQVFISHVQGQGYMKGCYVNNPIGWGDVYFSDCRFDANNNNGFEAFRCSGLYLSNVSMYGNGVSGLVLGTSGSAGAVFAENVFLSNVVADSSGLMNGAIYCADTVIMSNCWFATQKTAGSASGGMHGLYIENSSNITLEACMFRNNYDNGIYMTSSNYVSVSGCIFRKNGQRSNSSFGADLNYSTKITFNGNLFVPENSQIRGILVNNCDHYLVTNNCLDGVSVAVETRNDPTGVKKVVENNLS